MNNLKRILSLALASVMLVGMMVVGASATDYPDDDQIVNKTAVETLAALGIMNGDDRGFRPQDGLKRAEAAKMLATIHNKGVAVNFGTKDTPTFTDIKGHWAEGNIEYAAAFGIANGKGNGIFDPEGSLTVVQLARMTLNMLGIRDGITGSDWELQTTVAATNAGLFEGLDSFVPTANVTRDEAAQILANALYVPMQDGNGNALTYTGKVDETTSAYKVSLKGTNTANQGSIASIVGDSFDTFFEAYTTAEALKGASGKLGTDYEIKSTPTTVKVNGPVNETLAHKYLSLNTQRGTLNSVKLVTSGTNKGKYAVETTAGTYYTATDICSDLMGERVEVLYKSNTSVYGVTAAGSVIYEGTIGGLLAFQEDMDETEAGILDATTGSEWNNTDVDDIDWAEQNLSYGVKVARTGTTTDGDPVYNVTIIPTYVRQVTNATSTVVTLNSGVAGSSVNLTKKNITVYDGIAKGDWVVATAAANAVSGKVELAKAEITEEATVDAYRTNTKQVRVGGEWLTVLEATDFTALSTLADGASFNLVMVNGYIAAQEAVTAAAAQSKDMIFVVKTATVGNGLNADTYQARVITKEGKLVDINLKSNPNNDSVVGKWCTYKVKDNVYSDLTPVTTINGTDAKAVGFVKAYENIFWDASEKALTAGSTKLTLADDAVVIFYHDDDSDETNTVPVDVSGSAGKQEVAGLTKLETVTGKDIKALGADLGTSSATLNVAFTETVNGIEYVKFAFVADEIEKLPGAVGTDKWGYVVSAPYSVRDGLTYQLWNGEDTVTVIDTNTSSAAALGDVIQYEDLGAGKVAYKAEMAASDAKAITGYNAADGIIAFDGAATNNTLAEKIVVLYIDKTNREGVATGSIQLATESTSVPGVYTKNAYVKMNGTTATQVDVLVIEVNNNLRAGDKATAPAAGSLSGEITADGLKAKTPGVYDLTGTTLGDGISSNAAPADLVAFVFNARKQTTPASQKYTLTVTNKAGVVVYEETSAAALADGTAADGGDTEAPHFFYVDRKGAHLIAGATKVLTKLADETEVLFDTAANGAAYSYTITGADGRTYGSGTFSL